MTYGKKILTGIDQLLNALLAGWPDETLSSRACRWDVDGVRKWPRKAIDTMFFWEKNHCWESYRSEWERRQMPPELRSN